MNQELAIDRCKTFIDCQLQAAQSAQGQSLSPRPVVTLARETGSGAWAVAEKLAEYLNKNAPEAKFPWTFFDKNLVQRVLDEHHLPKHLGQYMTENKISEIDDAMGELLGLHPSIWTLVNYTAETILHLAQLGNVILVGRGATIITHKLGTAFHVRLVGSMAKRTEHVQEFYQLSKDEALAFIKREDRQRRRYYKTYFNVRLDDPLLYHLILNTDWVPYEEAARIIGEAVLHHQWPSKRAKNSTGPAVFPLANGRE